jgi:ATP-dependent Clp protease ATP-binding subunit ClpX
MNDQPNHVECNFCGKSRGEVDKLIVANDAGICNECIEFCADLLSRERVKNIQSDKKISKSLDPHKIRKFLDEYVIGQDDAKTALSVAVVNHYKRIYFQPTIELEKSNLLIYGATGSGKTLLAKTVARYLNVPFVIADATTLTQAGYVGDDVESVIGRLLGAADNDVELCQKGIVFIDEIDKIGRKSESASIHRDVGGEGVQQALLKLVEGTKCTVSVNTTKKHPALDTVEVDTSNILFIAGGTFDGLEKIVGERTNKTGIGFMANQSSETVDMRETLPEDFIKFGMIPEFVGRFPIAVGIETLSLEDLTRILIEPKNSLIQQMAWYFSTDDIELEFDDSAIISIAQTAIDQDIGARGLKSIIEKALMKTMYSINDLKRKGISKIRITEDVITHNKEPEYINHER